MAELTLARLRELLEYDPKTGVFRWHSTRCGRALAGAEAGTIYKNGYRYLWVDGRRHFAHRLAWFYMTGRLPKETIDHIDCNKSNNAFANLREASESQNHFRIRSRRVMRGVYGIGSRWRAKIGVKGQDIHLGYFATPEAAQAAYIAAAQHHFGKFAEGAI